MDYWNKKAAPWVSVAVLTGGLFSAIILFWIVRIESQIQITSI